MDGSIIKAASGSSGFKVFLIEFVILWINLWAVSEFILYERPIE
ncbi:hypothetical protein AYI68_g7214, partial [Smittium mucronatum]